jgi:penicillin-binding protein 1A
MDMNFMMNKVVEEGTGRRAIVEGVKAAGKTGTTNAYRDAWFVGYTGNYVAAMWFGNDDYSPTKRMTGGSLPAMTWKEIMTYAHQGIETKNIPGVEPGPTPPVPQVAAENGAAPATDAPQRPTLLSKKAADILLRVERLMEDAARGLPPPGAVSNAAGRTSGSAAPQTNVTTTADTQPPARVRGN